MWKLLKEVKANTEKLVHDVETLKENYNHLKESLEFAQSEVKILSDENKNLSEIKNLKCELLQSNKGYEEFEQRLTDLEDKYDDVEQYTRKFNLEIHGFPEQGHEEDNSADVMKVGNILGIKLSRDDIDIAHRMKTKRTLHHGQLLSVSETMLLSKSKLYRARLNLRKVDLHELGAERIYNNENLTTWRAGLLSTVFTFTRGNFNFVHGKFNFTHGNFNFTHGNFFSVNLSKNRKYPL